MIIFSLCLWDVELEGFRSLAVGVLVVDTSEFRSLFF